MNFFFFVLTQSDGPQSCGILWVTLLLEWMNHCHSLVRKVSFCIIKPITCWYIPEYLSELKQNQDYVVSTLRGTRDSPHHELPRPQPRQPLYRSQLQDLFEDAVSSDLARANFHATDRKWTYQSVRSSSSNAILDGITQIDGIRQIDRSSGSLVAFFTYSAVSTASHLITCP